MGETDNLITVKSMSGLVCLMTLAGYAWIKGWGWYFADNREHENRGNITEMIPNKDVANSLGLSTLNDKLWELSGSPCDRNDAMQLLSDLGVL